MARKQQPSEEAVLQALEAFMFADTWDESRQIVKERQRVLLSDAAFRLLTQLLEVAQAVSSDIEDVEQSVPVLTTHLQLLRRCREVGIDAAFEEFVTKLEEARLETYDRLFKLLAGMSDEEVTALSDLADDPSALDERLLEMLAQQQGDAPKYPPDPDAVWQITTLFRLIACEEPEDVWDLADEEPDLLDEETISLYQALAEAAEMTAADGDEQGDQFAQHIRQRLDILREYAADQAERDEQTEVIIAAFQGFISQDSWGDSHAYLGEHPELLTFEAGELLTFMVGDLGDNADEGPADVIRMHADLLRRCREVGRDAAFMELYEEMEGDEE